jgi:hypothetical protein
VYCEQKGGHPPRATAARSCLLVWPRGATRPLSWAPGADGIPFSVTTSDAAAGGGPGVAYPAGATAFVQYPSESDAAAGARPRPPAPRACAPRALETGRRRGGQRGARGSSSSSGKLCAGPAGSDPGHPPLSPQRMLARVQSQAPWVPFHGRLVPPLSTLVQARRRASTHSRSTPPSRACTLAAARRRASTPTATSSRWTTAPASSMRPGSATPWRRRRVSRPRAPARRACDRGHLFPTGSGPALSNRLCCLKRTSTTPARLRRSGLVVLQRRGLQHEQPAAAAAPAGLDQRRRGGAAHLPGPGQGGRAQGSVHQARDTLHRAVNHSLLLLPGVAPRHRPCAPHAGSNGRPAPCWPRRASPPRACVRASWQRLTRSPARGRPQPQPPACAQRCPSRTAPGWACACALARRSAAPRCPPTTARRCAPPSRSTGPSWQTSAPRGAPPRRQHPLPHAAPPRCSRRRRRRSSSSGRATLAEAAPCAACCGSARAGVSGLRCPGVCA